MRSGKGVGIQHVGEVRWTDRRVRGVNANAERFFVVEHRELVVAGGHECPIQRFYVYGNVVGETIQYVAHLCLDGGVGFLRARTFLPESDHREENADQQENAGIPPENTIGRAMQGSRRLRVWQITRSLVQGLGAGGPTGGVTVPGSERSLGVSLLILRLLKIVGQYSFTTLSSAPKPMRIPKRLKVFPGVRSPD